jgi:hypothetical protein
MLVCHVCVETCIVTAVGQPKATIIVNNAASGQTMVVVRTPQNAHG